MSPQLRLARTPPAHPLATRLIASHAASAVAMSMPWPALLALTWEQTHDNGWLAMVGVARTAPYILLSWYVGTLGDRVPRDRVLRVTTWARLAALVVAAAAVAADQLVLAVVAGTLTVAIGTPAYPSLAAAMPDLVPAVVSDLVSGGAPDLDGQSGESERQTRWLVTAEVGAFTAGPALGGLLLAGTGAAVSVLAAACCAAVGAGLLLRTPHGWGTTPGAAAMSYRSAVSALARRPVAVLSIVNVSAVNAILGALSVGLLALFDGRWVGGDREFGLSTAAIGAGALAAPAVCALIRLPATSQLRALGLLLGGLLVLLAAPDWRVALAPLAVVGVATTQVECAVTTRIQQALPRRACASALGITDTAMVGANLIGAASAPFAISAVGSTWFLTGLAVLTLVVMPLAPRSRLRRVAAPRADVRVPAPRPPSDAQVSPETRVALPAPPQAG